MLRIAPIIRGSTLTKLSLSLGMSLLAACGSLPGTSPESQNTPTSEPVSAYERPLFDKNENETDGLSAELLYDLLLSSLAFQEGEVGIATSAMVRAAQSTNDAELISRAVRMAIHNKSYVQAFTLGEQWVQLAEENPFAYIITGLAATLDQKIEPAINILEKLFARTESEHGSYFEQLGDVFLQHAKGEDAVEVITRLAGQYPNVSQGWMVLAGLAQKNKDMDTMREALEKVLEQETDNQNAAGYMLIALVQNHAEQAAFAEQFILSNPQSLVFQMQYARMLLRDGRDTDAHRVLLDLYELDKSNSEVINLIALLYQNQQDYENAAKYFKLRLAQVPEDDRSRIYYAAALQQLTRFDEAKIALNEVKDEDEVFDSRRQMAMLIEQEEGVDKALEYLDTVEGQNDDDVVQLVIDRELMLTRAKRDEQALSILNEALEDYPSNNSLLYHRALLFVEKENLAAHEADMQVLIGRVPENAHYKNTLGYSLLILSDRLEAAGVLIDQALELKPQDPYILDSKGWLEFKKGNLEQALEFLNQAFAKDRDAEIAAHIGEVYWVQGKHDKAKDMWDMGDEIEAENKSLIETKARFLQ